ncbi:MAG: PepSY-like domain-containing protein [Saprospiraceae bacterium]
MKHLLILLVPILILSCNNEPKMQEKDVPATVKIALKALYPDVKKVKWENENGNYEAGFESMDSEYSVLLDANGSILETEIEINPDALPVQVKEYVDKNYDGQKIKEAAKITDAIGNITFEAEIKGKDLMFDSNGNFIKVGLKQGKEND